HPDRPSPLLAFYPYGTSTLLYVVKSLFGRDNGTAIGVVYALCGALAVGFTHALAARLSRRVLIPRIVSLILIVYYPWISLGGSTLSEVPFSLFLSAAAFFALRLADRGGRRDGWGLGLSIAIGMTFRPQLLASLALLGVHALVRRRAWRRTSLRVL